MRKGHYFILCAISIVKIFGQTIKNKIDYAIFKVRWRLKNTMNNTSPVNLFPISLVNIGDHSYGPIEVYTYYKDGEGLEIGKYCSIAKGVKFILGGNHDIHKLMTFPVYNILIDNKFNESETKGKIVLEDDVWIGVGATVLSGVKLGQGCVVAAGSVVTKSFPEFSVIGGNPAKILKMRFDDDVLNKLKELNINVGDFSSEFIRRNILLFSSVLDVENLELLYDIDITTI